MTREEAKQHIILSTINAIEKNGLANVTTRVIAEEAGVNNAALHYYFGTKENLIEETLAATLDHMMEDWFEMLSSGGGVRERLRNGFDYLIEGTLKYPNLIRAHLQGPLMEGRTDSPLVSLMSNWIDRTYTELEADLTDEQSRSVRIAMHAAISSILIATLIPNPPGLSSEIDLRDPSFRAQYIDYFVNSILSQAA